MFEGLLERILLAYFGKYIEGVEKDHISLGILSGDLIIENVSFKKEAIDALELPIKLRFSKIQRLQLIVPLKKIQSSRVEIYIKNVCILVSAKDKKEWNLQDFNSFFKKMENIQYFIKKQMEEKMKFKQQQRILQQSENQMEGYQHEKAGFLDRLVSKIIDNIYIQIQDVHFRYDHDISNTKFFWGITIHKIESQSVDDKWQNQKFYDRSGKTSFDQQINKKVTIEKLALYWNAGDPRLISDKSPQEIYQKMNQDMMFDSEAKSVGSHDGSMNPNSKYIFNLKAEAQMVQTVNLSYKIPEYKVNVQFETMNFFVKHTQVQEILILLDFFNGYQYELKIEKDKFKLKTIKPDFDKLRKIKDQEDNKERNQIYLSCWAYYVNRFIVDKMRKQYIEFYLKSLQKKQPLKSILTYREYQILKTIVLRNSIEDLQDWTQTAYEIKERNKNLKMSEETSIQWKFWKTSLTGYKQIQEEQIKLRRLIETELYNQRAISVPQNYVWLEFYLVINTGGVKLSRRDRVERTEEGFHITWEKLKFQMHKRDNNYVIELTVDDMEIQMYRIEKKNNIKIPIMRKIRTFEYNEKPLFHFTFEKQPINKPKIFSRIFLEFERIEIILFIGAIRRLLTYFRVSVGDEKREIINQKIDQIQEQGRVQLEDALKNEIKIMIFSPLLVIPLQQINDPESPCWVCKLGDLSLQTIDSDNLLNMNQSQRLKNIFPQGLSRSSGLIKQFEDNVPMVSSGGSEEIHKQIFTPINLVKQKQTFKKSAFKLASSEGSSDSGPLQPPQVDYSLFDFFQLKLESVMLQYFSSMNYFYNYLKFHKIRNSESILKHSILRDSTKIDIIQNFSITVQIQLVKSQVDRFDENLQNRIELLLPELKISITHDVIKSLKQFNDSMSSVHADSQLSNILQMEKNSIELFSNFRGVLKQRGNYFRNWQPYYAIMSGWYIYMYLQRDDKDYDHYLSLRNCIVQECEDLGISYCFKITVKSQITYLSCKNQQDMKKWIWQISQKAYAISEKAKSNQFQNTKLTSKRHEDSKLIIDQPTDQNSISFISNMVINKINIQFEDEKKPGKEIIITVDGVAFKVLTKDSDSYIRFLIKQLLMVDRNKDIIRSIVKESDEIKEQYQKVNVKEAGYMGFKFDKIQQLIEDRKYSQKHAIKLQIINCDQKARLTVVYMLRMSELQINYRKPTIDRLLDFFNLQDPNKIEINEENAQKQIPKKQNISFAYIPTTQKKQPEDFSQKKESVSYRFEEDEVVYQEEKQIKDIYILSDEIKVNVVRRNGRTLCQLNIEQMYGELKLTDQKFAMNGQIYRVRLSDVDPHNNYHVLLGCVLEEKQQTSQNLRKLNQSQMVEFKWTHFFVLPKSEQSDHCYDALWLRIQYSYIDYIHASYLSLMEYLDDEYQDVNIPTKKADIFEMEQDYDQITAKILHPKLYRLNVYLIQPIIILKPLTISEQSVVFSTSKVSFEVRSQLEKNRTTQKNFHVSRSSFSSFKRTPQEQYKFDSIWCQNTQFAIEKMQINIKTTDANYFSLSNEFNIYFRQQGVMFANEYERLFQNQKLDKRKEMRIKISDIQIQLLKTQYEFFQEVMQSNLAYKKKDQNSDRSNIQEQQVIPELDFKKSQNSFDSTSLDKHSKNKQEETIIFSISSLRLNLMEKFYHLQTEQKDPQPVVTFELRNISTKISKFNDEQYFYFSVKSFNSRLYDYFEDVSHKSKIMKIEKGVINSLVTSTKQLIKSSREQFVELNRVFQEEEDESSSSQEIYEEEDPEKIFEQLKTEFYNQISPQEEGQQLYLCGQQNQDESMVVNLSLFESKILFDISYILILKNFFTTKQYKAQQQKPPTAQKISKSKYYVKLKRSLILLKGQDEKQIIVLQGDIAFNSIEDFTDKYHKNFHAQDDVNFKNKFQQTILIYLEFNEFQIYSAYIEKLIEIQLNDENALRNLRKRQILSPTNIKYEQNVFQCNCDKENIKDIIEEKFTIGKLRIHMSYHDLILIYETLDYQKEIAKSAEYIFKKQFQDPNEDFNEMDIPQKPQETQKFQFSIKSLNSLDSVRIIQPNKQKTIFAELEKSIDILQQEAQRPKVQSVSISGSDSIRQLSEKRLMQDKITNQEEPSSYFRKRNIEFEGLEIVIINDLSRSYVPFMLCNLTLGDCVVESNQFSQLFLADITFQLQYFNPIAGRMEPIIEKNQLTFHMTENSQALPKLNLLVGKKYRNNQLFGNADLNINLSSEMLSILFRTISLWRNKFNESQIQKKGSKQIVETKLEKMSESISFLPNELKLSTHQRKSYMSYPSQDKNLTDKVTLFTVQNNTGYLLKIVRDKDEMDLPQGMIKNYVVESHESEYAKTFEDAHQIQIVFRDKQLHEQQIQNVKVNEVCTRKAIWNRGTQRFLERYFICSIQMQNINKNIVISSPYILENYTDCLIQLILFNQTFEQSQFILDQNEQKAIPIELVDETTTISIRFSDKKYSRNSSFSEQIKLSTILSLNKDTEIKHDNFITIVRNESKPNITGVSFISFHPIAYLKNCLPVPLYLHLESNINTLFYWDQVKFYQVVENKPIQLESHIFNEPLLKKQFSLQIDPHSNRFQQPVEKSLDFQFDEQFLEIQPQGTFQIHNMSKKEILSCKLMIKGLKTSESLILYQNNLKNYKESVELHENQSNVQIYVHRVIFFSQIQSSHFNIYFFAHCCIINTTPYDLIYFTLRDSKSQTLPGQNQEDSEEVYKKILICNEQKNLQISLRDPNCLRSNEVQLSVLGSVFLQFKHRPDQSQGYQLYEFGINITTMTAMQSLGIYTKVIEIIPKYVMINKCDFPIAVYQTGLQDQETILSAGTREIYIWPDCRQEKQIYIIPHDQNIFQKQKHTPRKLLNDYQQQEHHIIDIESNRMKEIKINRTSSLSSMIKLETFYQGMTKYLLFTEFIDKVESIVFFFQQGQEQDIYERSISDPKKEEIETLANISFESIGISFIIQNQNKIIESNYLYFKNIEIGFSQTKTISTCQLRIKFFNLDNNTAYDTTTPVNMTPQAYKELLNHNDKYFFDSIVEFNHKIKKVLYINTLKLAICPIAIKLDEEYLEIMANAYFHLMSQFENDDEEKELLIQPLRVMLFQSPQKRSIALTQLNKMGQKQGYFLWNFIDVHKQKQYIQAKEIFLPQIDLVFSLNKRYFRSEQPESSQLFNFCSTALGTAIQNIDEAPIKFSGLYLAKVDDSKDALMQTIGDHYKSELISSLFKVIGSIEIIGNPVGLFQKLSVGIIDFVEKPYEGIKNGPLDFGVGLAKGTGSLIKNTVSGTFYTINKITGSISNGVSLLSMDDEYLERRRVFMLRCPKHLFDGLGQSCKSVFLGISDGISGLAMQPIRESQKDGFVGFLKGTAKGITGLVVKPISGILDASAKAAESITLTANHFDDKPYNQRVRVPRVFYERSKYFIEYNEFDAQLMNTLQVVCKGELSQITYLSGYVHKNDFQRILILSYSYIALVDLGEQKILECVPPSQCENIQVYNNSYQLEINVQQKDLQSHPSWRFIQDLLLKIHYIDQNNKQRELVFFNSKNIINEIWVKIKYLIEQVKNDYQE